MQRLEEPIHQFSIVHSHRCEYFKSAQSMIKSSANVNYFKTDITEGYEYAAL